MARAKIKKAKAGRAVKPAVRGTGSPRPRRRQYGVIPVRVTGRDRLEVLLLTSRGTGRWVIPKGWPMPNRTPAGAAMREAYEEAGLKGRIWSRKPVGSYRYRKTDEKFTGEIVVHVFLLAVKEQLSKWPESAERRTKWFSIARAASLVKEKDLSALLRSIPEVILARTRKKSA